MRRVYQVCEITTVREVGGLSQEVSKFEVLYIKETEEEALKEVEKLLEKYPNDRFTVIPTYVSGINWHAG